MNVNLMMIIYEIIYSTKKVGTYLKRLKKCDVIESFGLLVENNEETYSEMVSVGNIPNRLKQL